MFPWQSGWLNVKEKYYSHLFGPWTKSSSLQCTWLLNSLNFALNLFCAWKDYLSNCSISPSRVGPVPLGTFLYSSLAGIVWNTTFVTVLPARLIKMRLLISSVEFHLQLNGWWCLGYGLINKFNKHELRIYDEPRLCVKHWLSRDEWQLLSLKKFIV